jgi:hypothetical protein
VGGYPVLAVIDDEARHRAEVRSVLRWRESEGREWVQQWLYGPKGVEKTRGKAAADRIAADAAEQWRLGNRGAWGDWRPVEAAT